MREIEDDDSEDEGPPESFPDDGNRESLGFVLGLLFFGGLVGALLTYFVMHVFR
jgi:hypothetical protein